MLFQDALAERLGVMHPSRDDLHSFLEGHPPQVRRLEWAANSAAAAQRLSDGRSLG